MTMTIILEDGVPVTVGTTNTSDASFVPQNIAEGRAEGFRDPASVTAETIVSNYGPALHRLADS